MLQQEQDTSTDAPLRKHVQSQPTAPASRPDHKESRRTAAEYLGHQTHRKRIRLNPAAKQRTTTKASAVELHDTELDAAELASTDSHRAYCNLPRAHEQGDSGCGKVAYFMDEL